MSKIERERDKEREKERESESERERDYTATKDCLLKSTPQRIVFNIRMHHCPVGDAASGRQCLK